MAREPDVILEQFDRSDRKVYRWRFQRGQTQSNNGYAIDYMPLFLVLTFTYILYVVGLISIYWPWGIGLLVAALFFAIYLFVIVNRYWGGVPFNVRDMASDSKESSTVYWISGSAAFPHGGEVCVNCDRPWTCEWAL